MSEENACSNRECLEESCDNCNFTQPESLLEEFNPQSSVKKVIGVVSGKGGVGKSLVTASLAVRLADKGYKVGIMDADITGPSIPKIFGIKQKARGSEFGIIPAESSKGIKIMSINLLLETDDTPVIWRGPVIAGVVKQFWSEVFWGDLDYLLIDMPPGTGDVPLTVFQSIPVDGIMIVTSPQDLVKLIVTKAFNMAKTMSIPVFGIVENYSYFQCPDCGKVTNVFGKSSVDDVAMELGIEVLGKIPIITEMAELADAGLFDKIDNRYIDKAVEKVQI